MAKGVKKIEWVYAIGQLYNPSTGSAPNAGLVVKPDHMIFFTIKEGFPIQKKKINRKGHSG